MQIGIHTFVWNDGQTQHDIETAMEKTREAGYSFIEFPGLDPKAIDVDRLARRAAELNLTIAASAGLPPDHDLTSSDSAIAKRGEAFLYQAVNVARDLGSKQLSGPIFSAHQKFPSLPTREGWLASASVVSRVAEKAKAAGVALCLEILNRYETNLLNTVQQGLAYMRDTGSDNVFLHLDTYHMNIEEADPAQAIRLAGPKVGYFHVGESNRGYLGNGNINFAPSFDALVEIGYDKVISVEAFNSQTCNDHLKMVCSIWRENWTDDMAFAKHSKAFMEMQWKEAQLRAEAYKRN